MDELMLVEYLKNKGIGKDMSEHEFMDRFREVMSDKYRNGSYKESSMRNVDESEYFPVNNRNMYDDFYTKRHDGYLNESIGMFNSSNSKGRFSDRFNRMSSDRSESDVYKMIKSIRESSGNEHFNESYARYLVSNMYHFEGGRKYTGEKFDMTKAREVCERYRGIISQSTTCADIYVAINSQYHDYSELFKTWFGDDIEQKIIESAVIFWFKDDDYNNGSKLLNYFKEI